MTGAHLGGRGAGRQRGNTAEIAPRGVGRRRGHGDMVMGATSGSLAHAFFGTFRKRTQDVKNVADLCSWTRPNVSKPALPAGPISRYFRPNVSWSADGSSQSQTWSFSLDSDSLSTISRSAHGMTPRQQTKIADFRCPNRHPQQRGNGLVTPPTMRDTPPRRTESGTI